MNAIILFDTKYGNTETVANAIANGMKEVGFSEVVVQNGGETTHNELLERDIWILGSPTHRGRTSANFKRLLRWLRADTVPDTMGFAFETRLEGKEGGAASIIQEAMRESGIEMIHGPESFVVETKIGPLASGERERAITLGRRIAEEVRSRLGSSF